MSSEFERTTAALDPSALEHLGGSAQVAVGTQQRAGKISLGYLPLAHPSPRNQPWLVKNRWFEEELALDLRNVIQALTL